MLVEDKKDINLYYEALVNKDTQYLGVFYVCVKTTGIFCVSTCTARKPKPKNVIFFTTSKEALQHGYRPCKVCNPAQKVKQVPDEVKQLIQMVAEKPEVRISDGVIRSMGIPPEKIRRWFNQHHGMTFQAYQRMIRINSAYSEIKNGNSVTSSAFKTGYDSLSGFGSAFKNLFGMAPENSTTQNVIHLHRFETPLGPMYAGATDEGLCLLEFTDRRMLETEFADLRKRLNGHILPGENEFTKLAEKQVLEYFEGTRAKFDIPLVIPGTEFQVRVWEELGKIPPGKTRSYQQQAEALGNPDAVRAVARANGMNRIAIIIPCHRVIGSDGSLTGYAGGLPRKKWLLEHEGAIAKDLELF
ncbi:bifunctional transcriptional activator/DNA repair enzyme AdaA [Marinoscillum sp. MHG1-6]|uniref:bifunctional transcriptional activator/DNA repair enzyme AdaA n=1 Tax=Marinoscillum sp. MHG1-6 TaxID=2959627 RepID=UPI002157FA69|nr:bifunctional transcriptional activator/DNA repair protein Ada [Marinoscillum sp. MHG1-6]